MIGMNHKTYIKRLLFRTLCLMLAAFMAAGGLLGAPAYADDEDDLERPVREVHKVAVGSKQYCFFATHYVVLTPEEVSEMSDEELNAEVLQRAGIYMKEANCHKSSHKAITPEAWSKSGGTIFLSSEDIESIRAAVPEDGRPVKLHMDLNITTEPLAEPPAEETKVYTTFKRTSPRLLFAAIATPADAALGEEICEEEEEPAPAEESGEEAAPRGVKALPAGGGPAGEMLPEFRTANMIDRSGKPVEETLKDGEPVKLEWIEPGKKGDREGKASIFRSMPAVLICSVLIAAALAVLILRKRRSEEE